MFVDDHQSPTRLPSPFIHKTKNKKLASVMFATYERRRKWLPRRHHASLYMWRARAHAVKPFREMLVEYRFVINIMSNHAICGSLRRGNRRFPNLVRSETVIWAWSIPLGNHWYEGFPPRAGPCCLVEERNSLTFSRFWWIWYREMELHFFFKSYVEILTFQI